MQNLYALEKIAWYTQQERLAEAQANRLAHSVAGSSGRRGFVASVAAAFRAGQLGPVAEPTFPPKLIDQATVH